MRYIIRDALAISAIVLVVIYWVFSEMPLDNFEFTVVQLLAILVIVVVIGERRRG